MRRAQEEALAEGQRAGVPGWNRQVVEKDGPHAPGGVVDLDSFVGSELTVLAGRAAHEIELSACSDQFRGDARPAWWRDGKPRARLEVEEAARFDRLELFAHPADHVDLITDRSTADPLPAHSN